MAEGFHACFTWLAARQVSEAGTHQALLARGGQYAEMFELQAEGYR